MTVSLIVNERYERLKCRMSQRTSALIRRAARENACTLSAVVHSWPHLLPKRLRPLASSCFVDTRQEWLTARRDELRKALRRIERELSASAAGISRSPRRGPA